MLPTPAENYPDPFARRRVLRAALALAGVAGMSSWPRAVLAADTATFPTPAVAKGPFYPTVEPADSDADLALVAGRGRRAQGTLIYLSGRVTDTRGRPLAGAVIELWQANAFGRYAHPWDSDASGPLDPDFQGFGRLASDAQGQYRIKTIKPAPYTGRTAHVHFIAASNNAQLVTQMFFEGEPGNARDGLFRSLSRDEQRAATARPADRSAAMEPDAIALTWDIVLRA